MSNQVKNIQLIVDLTGPIIDISKIADFQDVPNVRYMNEKDIAAILTSFGQSGWDRRGVAVLERTFEVLKSKSRVSTIDKSVLEMLCMAKVFADVRIISSVPDYELFKAARELIIEYSKVLCDELNRKSRLTLGKDSYIPFSESEKDTEFILLGKDRPFSDLPEMIRKETNQYVYRIVFDDEVNMKLRSDDKSQLVHKWVSGFRDVDYLQTLKSAILDAQRKDVCEKDIDELFSDKVINLSTYLIKDDFKFFVFDDIIKKNLKKKIEAIETILENEISDIPVCVFIAGSPGTGKSYFVKQFAKYLKANEQYPIASLSGIPDMKFAEVVKKHIKTVLDESTGTDNKRHIAFLDEVDTEAGMLAFRFLMDAMTGNFTDEDGKVLKRKTNKLVWLFAGSAGSSRDEFIECFYNKDKKVVDFFDRIHFDMVLPTVDRPGQAILAFLSSLCMPYTFKKGKKDKTVLSIKIQKDVLKLFGLTSWKSVRQMKTICRIAYAEKIKPHIEKNECITLDDFDGIMVSNEFHDTFEIIKNQKSDYEIVVDYSNI